MDIFDMIGPIMIGPSSSHTAGAARLGRVAWKILGERAIKAEIQLSGSFAQTYRGHGTDKALIAGIMGIHTYDEAIRHSLELAEQESCVIIGRCADYILKDHPKRLNVFIYSTPEDKIQRIQEYLGGNSEVEAKRMMRDMDKKRRINYNYYTDRKWGDVRHYSLALNSGELGLDRCVDLIVNAAEAL